MELKELQATLANIEEARPFEDLTVRLLLVLEYILICLFACLGGGRRQRPPTDTGSSRDHGPERQMDCTWYVHRIVLYFISLEQCFQVTKRSLATFH